MSNRIPGENDSRSPRELSSSSMPPEVARLETLLRESRRLMANKAYQNVVEKLEIHRPAEWAVVNETSARLIRLLGQAYLAQRDFRKAQECLEHLRALQHEKSLLSRNDHAATLSDLCRCYREMQLPELASQCQEEARRLLQSEE